MIKEHMIKEQLMTTFECVENEFEKFHQQIMEYVDEQNHTHGQQVLLKEPFIASCVRKEDGTLHDYVVNSLENITGNCLALSNKDCSGKNIYGGTLSIHKVTLEQIKHILKLL